MLRHDNSSSRACSISSDDTYEAEISVEDSDNIGKPRMGLGSTANENIALRRNYREMELLWKTHKVLGNEEVYVLKLIELYEKSVKVNYKRLTKRVSRIKSHLSDEEINEMENDLRKKEFADKYRMILHNQDTPQPAAFGQNENQPVQSSSIPLNPVSSHDERTSIRPLEIIKEETEESSPNDENTANNVEENMETEENHSKQDNRKKSLAQHHRGQPGQQRSSRSSSFSTKPRPDLTPNTDTDNSETMQELIPTLEGLLDQLHNVKPHQFYENQRKLKLYEIRLVEEELKAKRDDFFKSVDAIVNWDKPAKEEDEEEKVEEEKPRQRKTSFMRSVLRNFSMELMMKTMQYGWTDLGQCRYLRTKGGDDDVDTSGANTLAKETMKIRLDANPAHNEPLGRATKQLVEPGFDADGKMIRTADLLGLK